MDSYEWKSTHSSTAHFNMTFLIDHWLKLHGRKCVRTALMNSTKFCETFHPSSIPLRFLYTLRKDWGRIEVCDINFLYPSSKCTRNQRKVRKNNFLSTFSKIEVISFLTHFLSCFFDHYIRIYLFLNFDVSKVRFTIFHPPHVQSS